MRNKKLVMVGAAIALATVAASCGDSGSSSAPAATTTTTTVAAATTDVSAEGTIVVTAGDTNGVAGDMTFDLSSSTVKAGEVTITLDNIGTIEHEAVVLKTDTPYDELVIGSDDRVDEADSVGEVAETPAGQSDSVTLTLEPGNYVILCNIAAHYRLGMVAALTVTA